MDGCRFRRGSQQKGGDPWPTLEQSARADSRAFVEAFLDSSRLERGLAVTAAKIKAWGAGISAMGRSLFLVSGAVLAPLGLLVKTFADMGSALNAASQRTGIAVEELSALQFAAEQSSASFEELEAGIRKMQAQGKGKGTADLLKFADQIAAMNDPAKQVAKAMDVFGKAGVKLLPMLKGGADGLRDLMDKAEAAGLVMSTADAQAATALGDSMSRMGAQVKFAAFQVGAALAPAIMDLLQELRPILAGWIKWIKENRGLVVLLAKAALVVAAVGAALFVTGHALGILGGIIGGIIPLLAALVAGFKLFVLLLPVIAAVGTAAVLIWQNWDKVAPVLEKVFATIADTEIWKRMRNAAVSSWQGIVDAIASGELGLAWEIAVAGLKVGWLELVAELKVAWVEFVGLLEDTWQGAIFALVKAGIRGWAELQKSWSMLVQGMKLAWLNFQGLIRGEDAVRADKARVRREGREERQTIAGKAQEQIGAADKLAELQRDARERVRQAEIAGIRGDPELQAARDNLAGLVDMAARLRAQRAAGAVPPAPPPGQRGQFGESVGTFSAFALRGLGENSFERRQAEAAEEAAALLQEILAQMAEGALT